MSGTSQGLQFLGVAPEEWEQLTTLPSGHSGGTYVYNAIGTYVVADSNEEHGPVQVREMGSTLNVQPLVSFSSVREALRGSDVVVDDPEVRLLKDWYDKLVAEIIQWDLRSPQYDTPSWNGYAFIDGLTTEELTDELVGEIDTWELDCEEPWNRAMEIAETIPSWRDHVPNEPAEVERADFVAEIRVA